MIVTTFTHKIVMLFDRGRRGKEMRGIIDYSGEKSFVSFITHAGNGSIVVAVTESTYGVEFSYNDVFDHRSP